MLKQQVSDWQGRVLGHYQFLRLLGRGGMSEVWLVVDQRDQRQLALKLLSGVLVDEDQYRRMFQHEARVATSLNHPHVLAVYDFGEDVIHEDEVVCYLVMPYIAGGTLRERMSNAKRLLPILESLHYLKQAAEAIDYLHTQQVLHRDIKPTNMLLERGSLFANRSLTREDSRAHSGWDNRRLDARPGVGVVSPILPSWWSGRPLAHRTCAAQAVDG